MQFMKHLALKHRHQTPSSKQPPNQIINQQTPNSMSMMIKPVQEIHKSSLDDLDTSISPAVIQKLRRYSQNNSSEERIEWLQSQVIGNQIEFDTPFGQRMLTYADHTASGRSLKFIEDYIVDKVLPSYGNTHTDDSFVGERTTKLAHKASEFIKKCMGGGDDDSIIFCGSGTTAAIKRLQEVIGIAVSPIMRDRVLESVKEEERWVVFIGPYEHHSNILSWRQSLAEVVEIGLNPDGLIDLEELERELKSSKYLHRPKLGSFSACSNVTGIATDTRAVARLLHRHGAFACFDFAASGPYVEINMRSGEVEGYDAVYLSPHKFIGGPGTPGILLMSNAMYRLGSLPPSTCGGGTVSYVNGFNERDTLYSDKIEEREDAGTPQIIQKIRAALAFWVKEYIGHELIDLHESFYIETALRRLLPNPNIKVLGNTKAKRLSILSFLVYPSTTRAHSSIDDLDNKSQQPLNGRFVAKLLNDLFGIQARGGCACAGPYGHSLLNVDEKLSLGIRSVIQKGYSGMKPGWTRISFPYYMAKEEFAFIMAAVEFIGMYGHRFLPLYTFHWESGDWSFDKRAFKYHLMEAELANASRALFSGALGGVNGTRDLNALIGIENSLVSVKEVKSLGKTNKFAAYLEAAKRLALSLPADPPRNSVPDEIVVTLKLYE